MSNTEEIVRRLRKKRRVLVLGRAPLFMRHLLYQVYRDTARSTAQGWVARFSAAGFDTAVSGIIRGFTECTGTPAHPHSGRGVVMFMRMVAAFNLEIENRAYTHNDLEIKAVCARPLVQSKINDWEYCCRTLGLDMKYANFWDRDDVKADYTRYIDLITSDNIGASFGKQIESIELDSGTYMAYLFKILGALAGAEPQKHSLEQAWNFGIAAKLVDDIVDFAVDLAEGRYNLLIAGLSTDHIKENAVMRHVRQHGSVPLAAWGTLAPDVISVVLKRYTQHYEILTSGSLRDICDLSLSRTLRGRRLPHSRMLRHVGVQPEEGWR